VRSHIEAFAFQHEDYFDDVMCIEANPATYEILKKNIRLRDLKHKMSAQNIAANGRSGPISFLCNTENSGGSKIYPACVDIEYIYDKPRT